MTRTVRGTVHGRTIELEEDLGVPDGQEVDVLVTPTIPEQPWGEGIKRSAGAAANVPDFDEVFLQIERDRKAAMFRGSQN